MATDEPAADTDRALERESPPDPHHANHNQEPVGGALTVRATSHPESPVAANRWYRAMAIRIGIVPLPVYLLLLAIIVAFWRLHRIPTEICMVIAIMIVGGFLCSEIGGRIPGLRSVGGAAIVATFAPSCLVYYHITPRILVKPVADFFASTNFLYLFIAAIIVGSILAMDRRTLIAGFVKIFVPLAAGSVAAAAAGTTAGALLGLGARHTLFFVVVPIMAGGVGEGAIPLSIGYAERLHRQQSEIFGTVLPPVMLGSLMAILIAGLLNSAGKRFPSLTGEGRLQPGADDGVPADPPTAAGPMDVRAVAAAGSLAIALYLAGLLIHELAGLPAPIGMLFLAVAAKVARAVPPDIERGAFFVYDFFRTAVVYPLLFAVGAAMTPWDKLVAAVQPANVLTIFVTVATLMGVGFLAGRWTGMYPIETAIINGTHSGQGGTGDIAILTAANRMQLLPFAQVATRIGGAITVTLALIALSRFG